LNHSQRAILYVGGSGPNNYTKIQDAVDNASSGDMIFVYQGMYYEHVILNKQVTLLGEIRDQTIIDGSQTGNAIKITADGVTVQQFSLQNAGIGVYIVHSSNQTIIQNNITNNWEGIGLLDSAHNTISGNIITHNGFEGINPVQTTFTVIQDNTIIDHLQGISLSESTGNTIVGNNFYSNLRGIEIQQSSNNNKMFHNNFFLSEDSNGYDTCSNTWDDGYPSGGNYWDDYNGVDANHDGIGDTPYNIAGGGGNKDHYPLMIPCYHPPYLPSNPIPLNGAVNIQIAPELSVFVFDPNGDTMNVTFYDASTDQVIGVDNNVGSSTRASITWNGLENMTQYHWYAIVDDGMHITQSETWKFTTGNGMNHPPAIPTINGLTSGNAGQSYNYSFLTTDPEEESVFYYIDWGDSTNNGWIGPFQSGESVNVSHTWATRGTYTIKAKAKDMQNAESSWGTLSIKMPMSSHQMTMLFMHFFERFFERFPSAFPFLHHLFIFYGSL
jgi:parallel beta-helix repeat protein